MRSSKHRCMPLVSALLVTLAGTTTGLAQIAATYTGPNNGLYSLPANWSGNVVPVNAGPTTYNVTVPAALRVNFDLAGAFSINSLSLTNTSAFEVLAGGDLTLNSASVLSGAVRANGAQARFASNSAATNIDGGLFHAIGGGSLMLASTSYVEQGVVNHLVFYSQGTSTLGVGALQSIQMPPSIGTFQVEADGSLISFDALSSVVAPPAFSGSSARFLARGSSGHIHMPSLPQITGTGWYRVENGGVITAPALSSLVADLVDVYDPGSAFTTPAIMSVDGASFYVRNGATYATQATAYTDLGSINHLAFYAQGSSMLNASSIQTLDTPGSIGAFQIEADGSVINLNGLTTFNAPSVGGASARLLARGATGTIQLSSLPTITGNGWFRVENGGRINAPSLSSLVADLVDVYDPGSAITTPAIMNIDGASFFVRNGGAYTTQATAYTDLAYVNHLAFYAQGSGSTLNASSITTLATPVSLGTFQVEADAGVISFGGLTAFNAPTTPGNSGRLFARNPGGRIDLPVLPTISGFGWLRVENGATINAASLNSLVSDWVQIYDAGSTLNTPPISNIDGAAFHVHNGAAYTTSASTYTDLGYVNHLAFYAQGGGTNLNASSIHTITTPGSIGTFQIEADNAVINFGGLNAFNAASTQGNYGRLFARNTGGRIELPALPAINGNGWFRAESGGTINAGALNSLAGTVVEIIGAGSTFNTPPIMNVNGASFYVRGGGSYSTQAQTYTEPGSVNRTAFYAQDTGTLLNAGSLRTIAAGAAVGAFQIEASANATVRFTDLTSVAGPSTPGNALRFRAAASGTVDLPPGVSFSGNISYSADTDGIINARSGVSATGGMSLTNGGTIVSSGDVRFAGGGSQLTGGIIRMIGAAGRVRLLEVGGRDTGIPGNLTDNLRLGQLIIGAPGIATQVRLDDCFDNARRGPAGQAEALYLTGIDGSDGLVLHPGASLEIGDIPTYVFMDGAWVHLNDMIKGDDCIDFAGGLICGTACKADWDRNGIINSADFFAFLTDFFTNNADFNCDLGTNSADFFSFLTAFFAGC